MCFQMDNVPVITSFIPYKKIKFILMKKKKIQTCLSMCNITVFVINVNVQPVILCPILL